MLKYEINYRDLASDTVDIPITNYSMNDNTDDTNLLTVTCHYDGDVALSAESRIFVSSQYDVQTSESNVSDTQTITFSPEITALNTNSRYFTFNIGKYYYLTINELNIEVMDNVPYLVFAFNDLHYFNPWDDTIYFYVRFVGEDNVVYEKKFENCTYKDEYTLYWKYDSQSLDIDNFMCSVFNSDTYTFIGYESEENAVEVETIPAQACFTDPIYIKRKVIVGCDEKYEYYEKECNDGTVTGLTVYRDQFLTTFTISTEIARVKIPIPISQAFDVTLQRENNIMHDFIEDEIRNAINSPIEMEKFVYHPVYVVNNSESSFSTEDIYKIKFNLHFRQHRGDEWSVDDNSFWNGVDNESMVLEGKMTTHVGVPFFSYTNRSKQSDLLSYLGFTNADVKYQKNKLKKSFLRLSVYDSDNPLSQNLLWYSMIYMDGGELFTKFMNNVTTTGYGVSEGDGKNDLTGAKVNLEYVNDIMDDDELEEHRLSSQITVSDQYLSQSSSEGFNIYLWADEGIGVTPRDLYMKVEFNHAGYGRTIPFMMPFYDYQKDGRYGIKTFEEIMTDWRDGNAYGIRKYTKYSYIHLKCKYDRTKQKRVYYLDPETYGNGVLYNGGMNNDKTPNELEINLYEAKVTFLNENDETV